MFLLQQTESAQFDVNWKVPAILYYAKRNYHSKYDLRSKGLLVSSAILVYFWSSMTPVLIGLPVFSVVV